MNENLYLQVLYSLFPSKTLLTSQPWGAAFRNSVSGFRSYNRGEWKNNFKKTSENSYLQVLFLSENIVTSQPLGAAFRNFVHVFHSYYREKLKTNQEKRVKTCTSSPFSSEIDVTYICFGQGRKYVLLLLFYISLYFIYIFFHWCAIHITVCYCLHYRIFNPESEYSTLQLLTSDSRYSYSFICSIHQLLTSDSSCLISCHCSSQSCSSLLHTLFDVPRNRLWAPASRRVKNL